MSDALDGLNLIELLDLLEPVPEPPAPALWPQTAGWVWLGLALAALALWVGRRLLARRRANAYRCAALDAIAAAGDDPAALAAILRRAALAAYPRRAVAGLAGDDWLAFLDRAYGGAGFREGPGRALIRAPYAPGAAAPGLAALAAEWTRRHRRAPAP
jgi:hypothetical protein